METFTRPVLPLHCEDVVSACVTAARRLKNQDGDMVRMGRRISADPKLIRLAPPPRREKPLPLWKRILRQHSFLYVAILTTIAGVLVTAAVPWFSSLGAPDGPAISVSDSSDTLNDLSYVFADEMREPPRSLPEGGVKSGSVRLKMLVQNSTGSTIRILDVRARILTTKPAVSGTLIKRISQGSASEVIGIGLWQDPPIARVLLAGNELGDPFFSFQSIEIPNSESRVIEVTLMADGHHYRYTVDLAYARDGKRYSVPVDTARYEVSGYAPTYRYAYEQQAGSFLPMNEAQTRSFLDGRNPR
jgi:hypothetical protein